MPREDFNNLLAFVAVAREASFTRAAAKLGVSQSALSHTIRGLEERLGLRLLTRTTRNVSPTEARERLLQTIGPRFDEIETELTALSELREKPAGTIRITTTEHAAHTLLWPKLAKVLPEYPDIKVEIIIEQGLTDIVAERYDAGVRLGEQIAKDMIAVRIGPDARMAVVGAPSYFVKRSPPKKPQDLIAHNCINLRLPTFRSLYAWEFQKGKRELERGAAFLAELCLGWIGQAALRAAALKRFTAFDTKLCACGILGTALGAGHSAVPPSSSSNAFASFKSAVSKPSVNQL